MRCNQAKELLFSVCEMFPDGTKSEEKRFSISKEESDAALKKYGFYIGTEYDGYGIIIVMFKKLYNFDIGPNGFRIVWDTDVNGRAKMLESGTLYWPGPRAPACLIGGHWWSIRRIT